MFTGIQFFLTSGGMTMCLVLDKENTRENNTSHFQAKAFNTLYLILQSSL